MKVTIQRCYDQCGDLWWLLKAHYAPNFPVYKRRATALRKMRRQLAKFGESMELVEEPGFHKITVESGF